MTSVGADLSIYVRRYARGDESSAETCDSFCTRTGRGHIHTRLCDPKLCGSVTQDGVRHHREGVLNLGANQDIAVDEYTHESFWETINFKDPCLESERSEFKLCGSQCASDEHDQVCF
jgi:hypothetical protein